MIYKCIKFHHQLHMYLKTLTYQQHYSFIFIFFGLQHSCLSGKRAFRTLDEPEVRTNNGLVCMQKAFSPLQIISMMGLAKRFECSNIIQP